MGIVKGEEAHVGDAVKHFLGDLLGLHFLHHTLHIHESGVPLQREYHTQQHAHTHVMYTAPIREPMLSIGLKNSAGLLNQGHTHKWEREMESKTTGGIKNGGGKRTHNVHSLAKREFEGLHHIVVGSALIGQLVQFHLVQDLHNKPQGQAPRGRRGGTQSLHSTVGGARWLVDQGLVGAHIARRKGPPMGVHILDDPFRNRPTIHCSDVVKGQDFQGVCQLFPLQQIPCGWTRGQRKWHRREVKGDATFSLEPSYWVSCDGEHP